MTIRKCSCGKQFKVNLKGKTRTKRYCSRACANVGFGREFKAMHVTMAGRPVR